MEKDPITMACSNYNKDTISKVVEFVNEISPAFLDLDVITKEDYSKRYVSEVSIIEKADDFKYFVVWALKLVNDMKRFETIKEELISYAKQRGITK